MTRYFTAIVKGQFKTFYKFRNITQMRRFVEYIENNYAFIVIFFYEGKNAVPTGLNYCGWYTTRNGFNSGRTKAGKRHQRTGRPDRSNYWKLVNAGKLPNPKK